MPPTDLILTKTGLLSSRDNLKKFFIDQTLKSLETGNNSIGPENFRFLPEQQNVISATRQALESNPNNAWHSIFVDTFGNTIGSTLNVPGQIPLSGVGLVDITSFLPIPKLPIPTSKEEAERWLISEALAQTGLDISKIPTKDELDKIEKESEDAIEKAKLWLLEQIGPIVFPPEIPKILPQIPTFSLLDLPGYEKLKEYGEKLSQLASQASSIQNNLENIAENQIRNNIPGIPSIPETPPFPGFPPIPDPPQIPGIPPIPGLVLPGIILGFLEVPLNILKSLVTDLESVINLAFSILSDIRKIPELIISEIIKQIEKIPHIKDILNSPIKPKFFIASFLSVIKFLAGAIGAVLVGSLLGAGQLSSSVSNLVLELF